ncbi:MAG: carboxypeptidase-like regulatory domain-containing protein [Pedobacter sp.]|nr:MAG: carboxypeptidase-like regulatory domain-containing protein [Pedobacter sp.]
MKRYFLLLLLILITAITYGQNSFVVSGTVKDHQENLSGASIYLNGFKISTSTDKNGKFVLSNITPGSYELLVQMIGYKPYSKKVIVADKSINVDITLSEKVTELSAVVIRPDPNRDYYLNLFKNFFIGDTPNSKECDILNLNVLSLYRDRDKGTLVASSNDFLIIENRALGYRIKYMLDKFEYNFDKKVLFFAGYSTFEEMEGKSSDLKRWIKNRETAYNGSAIHFIKSLYQRTTREEGFVMYKRREIPNKDRYPDSLIDVNLSQIMKGKMVTQLSSNHKEANSMSYWLKEKKKPRFLHHLERKDVLIDTLVSAFNENIKKINFQDELFIVYKNEKEMPDYEKTPFYQSRPVDLQGKQVSVLKMLRAPIYFYKNGMIHNPQSTLHSGFWAYEKMADSVPLDYVPISSSKSSSKKNR